MTRQEFIKQIEENQGTVRRFLTALCCGDRSLADDLAQETFIKAYLSSGGFRCENKFLTWIYRIAYNTFISHKRNVPGSIAITKLTEAENLPGILQSDSAYEYQELYFALSKLSEKERSAVLLHYMQGYSVNEIAEITGSSSDAVKKQLSRARLNLQRCLNL